MFVHSIKSICLDPSRAVYCSTWRRNIIALHIIFKNETNEIAIIMSATKTDEKTEESSAKEKNLDMDNKLGKLSCPFNWEMKDVIEKRNRLLDADENRFEMVVDVQDQFPEFALIYHLLMAYEHFMSDDLTSAMQCVNKGKESLAAIEEKGSLKNVEDVLQHIFVATKCHVLQELGKKTEVNELLNGIRDVNDMNKTQTAMLNACRCLGWSIYCAADNLIAIKSAEEAIKYEPNNWKWYFLLGNEHRALRRRHNSIAAMPNAKESSAFEKAFWLSGNVLSGVALAQMYRESRDHGRANDIYMKVYDLRPTCCKVRLQLALGFIRAKKPELAKNCLDYVAEKMPNSVIYDHYMAIYEEKCNRNWRAALRYYEATIKNTNFSAEWQYIECKKEVEWRWDPLPYMLSLLEKYDKDSDHTIQEINTRIGSYYLFEMRDFFSACSYLAKAIKISPNAKILKEHRLLFRYCPSVNIYHVLSEELELALQDCDAVHDDEKIAVMMDTLELCRKNCNDLPSQSASFKKWATNSQKSKSPRNLKDQGSKTQDKNDGSEADASCVLVKTLKDMNI